MTGQRRGYVIALVVAVLALVVSVGAAMTFMATGNGWHLNNAAQASSPDGWRQGLAGDGMMGQGRGGGGMMGDWDDQDTPSITTDQARTAAEAWAAANQPGATVGSGGADADGLPVHPDQGRAQRGNDHRQRRHRPGGLVGRGPTVPNRQLTPDP